MSRSKVPYLLALDVGTNSLGWAVLALDGNDQPCGILDSGVRIFSDGRAAKTGVSLRASYGKLRRSRRTCDRANRRKKDLLRELRRHGLMPKDEERSQALKSLDPYALRARGLDHPLKPEEIGRALMHLHQSRGFQSNRLSAASDEDAVVARGIDTTQQRMRETKARTWGELLNFEHRKRLPVKARPNMKGPKVESYHLYPSRALVRQEFEALWASQVRFHPGLLTEKARKAIHGIIFRQRPQRATTQGRCALVDGELRLPKAMPKAQSFRMWKTLSEVRVRVPGEAGPRPLRAVERQRVHAWLREHETLKGSDLGDKAGLPKGTWCSHGTIPGNTTGVAMAKESAWGPSWWSLPIQKQDGIVTLLVTEGDDDRLVEALVSAWGVEVAVARRLVDVRLPQGYLAYGATAIDRILVHLPTADSEYEATVRAGFVLDTTEKDVLPRLPFYQEVRAMRRWLSLPMPGEENGRIPNPTVHISMNQGRRVINGLLKKWGLPAQVTVELVRDLPLGNCTATRDMEENQKRNQRRREQACKEFEALGLPDTQGNQELYRLWVDLPEEERRCVYSGRPISLSDLFSGKIERDHILPRSWSRDNSFQNQVLCYGEENAYKGKRTPWDAWGHDKERWEEIRARVERFAKSSKSWKARLRRFEPSASIREDGFLDSQLNDTGWIAKATAQYLSVLVPRHKVRTVFGGMTRLLRSRWRLNQILSEDGSPEKNRGDHRHHAVDAIVIGCTTPAMVARVCRAGLAGRDEAVANFDPPWEGFYEDVSRSIDGIIVSHKKDHTPDGGFFKDTLYGVRQEAGVQVLSCRKATVDIELAGVDKVKDPILREGLREALLADPKKGARLFAERTGVRRIRVEAQQDTGVILTDDGRSAKLTDGYYCMDIFRGPDGSWRGEPHTSYSASLKGATIPAGRPDFLMRIHKGDVILMEGRTLVVRQIVVSSKALLLRDHRNADGGGNKVSLLQLQKRGARLVSVDEIGHVHEMTPRKWRRIGHAARG